MEFSVKVARAELRDALKQLAVMIPAEATDDGILAFDDGELVMELPGGSIGVEAKGNWAGRVRFRSEIARTLSRQLPEGDPLEISVRDDRLYFGDRFSTGCSLCGPEAYSIELPIDPPLWAVLGLRVHHTEEAIEAAGLNERLDDADTEAWELIRRAAKPLAKLGVTRDEVVKLVPGCHPAKGWGASRLIPSYFCWVRRTASILDRGTSNHRNFLAAPAAVHSSRAVFTPGAP